MTKEAYESAVSTGIMYTHIAQTLARDYTDMFYVNTDTEEFIEYRRGDEHSDLSEIRRRYDDETTIVVLTAYNWDDIHEEAQRIGLDNFLAKPLFPANVIEQFDRIARQNHMNLFREKERANLTGRRILLAEDMEINAEIMMDVLEMEGIEADHAEDGEAAVRMFEDSAPFAYAAVLMDVRMPKMDGLEAASAIRALDREDAGVIPIMALTANAFDEDVQRSLQAGMNAHLTKPVEPETLFRALGELVYEADGASGKNAAKP